MPQRSAEVVESGRYGIQDRRNGHRFARVGGRSDWHLFPLTDQLLRCIYFLAGAFLDWACTAFAHQRWTARSPSQTRVEVQRRRRIGSTLLAVSVLLAIAGAMIQIFQS